ncbi:MAG: formylglycine-generating enzyme family protein [Treponema sp.]|nr:formylglycine-generating enzyme family protein [Treponema sp.]
MKKAIILFLLFFGSFAVFAQQNQMVRINGGTFTMGSPENEFRRNRNETQHQVTISSFYMGIYLVTQKEYREIMRINPSRFRGDNLPVEKVSWFDAIEYCIKKSQREGLTPAYTMTHRIPAEGYPITSATVTWNRNANGYRLPTEAEWEYACRAGTTTAYNFGNSISPSRANYNRNRRMTTEVGSFHSNHWGLFDMHGNVFEWCWDWSGDYNFAEMEDPTGAIDGTYRVLRGGGWFSEALFVRSAARSRVSPSVNSNDIGFRIVRP